MISKDQLPGMVSPMFQILTCLGTHLWQLMVKTLLKLNLKNLMFKHFFDVLKRRHTIHFCSDVSACNDTDEWLHVSFWLSWH